VEHDQTDPASLDSAGETAARESPTGNAPRGARTWPPLPPTPTTPWQPEPSPPGAHPAGRGRVRITLAVVLAVILVAIGVGAGVALSRGSSKPNGAASSSSPSISPTARLLQPPNDFRASVHGLEVKLSWTPNPADPSVDFYDIFRNSEQIASVNAPATTYLDTSVRPGQTYSYRLGIRAATATVAIPAPPLSHAVPQGIYDAAGPVTSKSGYTQFGSRYNAGWKFASNCSVGPCEVKWTIVGFKGMKGPLTFANGRYSGNATGQYDVKCASGAVVVSNVAISLRVVKAHAMDGRWIATKLAGTVTQSEAAQLGCVSSRATANVTASLIG
jgi:hypothetical protein